MPGKEGMSMGLSTNEMRQILIAKYPDQAWKRSVREMSVANVIAEWFRLGCPQPAAQQRPDTSALFDENGSPLAMAFHNASKPKDGRGRLWPV